MKNSDIHDSLFAQAVAAIDSGDLVVLRGLLDAHPRLVRERLGLPTEGYFRHPYLIWFVADNPIRNPTLPGNIAEVTRALIDSIEKQAPETYSFQVDYTLGLVSTGRIPKECGIQIALMDVLIDAGAEPKGALGAIAQDNPEAAAHLIRRGAELTFAVAVGLGWEEEVKRLAATATPDDWSLALIVAAFRGNVEIIRYLLSGRPSVNVIPADCQGFHGHATALHHAVSSTSLETVKMLVEGGADLHAVDRKYEGTPLGWVDYLQREDGVDEGRTEQYREIEAYLRSRDNL
jgi:hypothetical protein